MPQFKSRQVFSKLYDEYKGLAANVIFNIAGKECLEDLVQETFIKVWKGLPAFSFRSTHKTWIYRIAVNVALDYCRKNFGKTEVFSESASLPSNDPELRASDVNLSANALGQLSPQERAVVTLRFYEELSFKEIASMLEEPEGTLKARAAKAKEKMKNYLKSQGVDYER